MTQRYVVPEAGLKAACDEICELGTGSGREVTRKVLEAFIRWQSENPRVPTGQQLWEMSTKGPLADVNFVCAEWQRRMYLAPEPEVSRIDLYYKTPEGEYRLFQPGRIMMQPEPYATLRDQFAMAALMGLLASGRRDTSVEMIHENVPAAYKYADSMLEVRK